ncbi:DUF1835 domain-containing protein [Levilactobacillus acidifarinae]|uniref:DUF1835 domain-containing protein n=1 Tax=Levilactobacillus acidifarinae DSM 19394 = JCM 15949 TaxID=1423715 RepID=A0A0R1LQR7_9LACO|nr:DUF1835 domain-containing protein [Levilactobacillus acidifarinae]KRK94434.1 hypothetical protein FD25_GL000396 [Levilactobacillus acidifarinae DSM 19394]GEO68177.1 hypothetical protein LAC03_00870 [Levilactobacillus acidifarinae]
MDITFNTAFAEQLQAAGHAVLALPLALQVGNLERLTDPQDAFWTWQGGESAGQGFQRSQDRVRQLKKVIATGDTLTVWVSATADDQLGYWWLCVLLGAAPNRLTQVTVPLMGPGPTPGTWQTWAHLGEVVLPVERTSRRDIALTERTAAGVAWSGMVRAASALRVLLNGNLVAVPVTFYDNLLHAQQRPSRSAQQIAEATWLSLPSGPPIWWYEWRLAMLR